MYVNKLRALDQKISALKQLSKQNSPTKGGAGMANKTSINIVPAEILEGGQTRNSGVNGANSNDKLGSQGRIKKGKAGSPN